MSIAAKLGTMRKAQSFTVYPMGSDGSITVQSDKSIGVFNPATGKGLLNTKGGYFIHLSRSAGAVPYEFPADFVTACIAAVPKKGAQIGGGIVVIA